MKLDALTERILNDIVPYLPEGYVVTGSGAYKLLIPSLANKASKDLDVIIYPTKTSGGSGDLVAKNITDKFYVTRLFTTKRGFQFSLVHKDTGCWVDIFPRKHTPRFVEVETSNGQTIRAHKLEEIVYGLCVGTLEKAYGSRTVLADSIEKLQRLKPHINLAEFSEIVRENISQTQYMTDAFDESINTPEIIEYVIANCQPYSPPGYAFDAYPTDQATTPNGLQIEDEATYAKAMKLHLNYLAQFKR